MAKVEKTQVTKINIELSVNESHQLLRLLKLPLDYVAYQDIDLDSLYNELNSVMEIAHTG